jgi:nitrate reductase NapD
MNVSSIVVQAQAADMKTLVEYFSQCDFCDYHFHDEALGKMVVTIEGEGINEEIAKLKKIQQTPKVIAADMMMAYSEEELDRERDKLQQSGPVPEMLNDESLRAEEIVYRGDLKKKNI